jgi:hypothetical protein
VVVINCGRLCARPSSRKEDLVRCVQVSCPMQSRVFVAL